MVNLTNTDVAQLFSNIAAAYEILGENRFKIIAYDKAAEVIAQMTVEIRDLWKDNKLDGIPGLGLAMKEHLDELFRTGNVKYLDEVMKKIPEAVFTFLLIPGIGPKRAYKLVTTLKIDDSGESAVNELEKAAKAGKIAVIPTFGDKSQAEILSAIITYRKGHIKERRVVLWRADIVAEGVMEYLSKLKEVKQVDLLGSLRRRVVTIGDIDIAVATNNPEKVIECFLEYPHEKLIERGPSGASVILTGGKQVDLRVQRPEAYGAMLQYFTGSKNHNIKLRSYALTKGMSLNEYGVKKTRRTQNLELKFQNYNTELELYEFGTEEEFYGVLGLPWIPAEMREDRGEIEAAIRQSQGKVGGLPKLVDVNDIRGDLHIHSNYDLSSAHDVGQDSMISILIKAEILHYEYVGFSDHNPSVSKHTESQIYAIMKKRKVNYEKEYYSYTKSVHNTRVHMFLMCEVDIDPNGKLALPGEAFSEIDAVIVSVHSSFRLTRAEMTKRVIKGLTMHPKVRIFGHPTARLIGEREGIDLDWEQIFEICLKRDIALEINSAPSRMDLPDQLVLEGLKKGCKFCINTDAHAVKSMDFMKYGVSVARRGWLAKKQIVNTMEYNEFKKWLIKKF